MTAHGERRPHVVIAVANLPVERDRRVIRQCRALEDAGYRVTVICPRGQRRLDTVPGTRDARIRSYPMIEARGGIASFAVEFGRSLLCVGWHLAWAVLRDRAVAAQVCNPPDVFWPLALVLRALRRPWLFDHHDLSPEIYATRTGTPNRLVTTVLLAFERLSQRCASAVISTNESYRELAITRGGCDPDRVIVVRNAPAAPELTATSGRRATLLTESEAKGNPPNVRGGEQTIVYLGVLGPQDGVEYAVLAAERLVELRGRLGWRMVIAGDGECLPALRALATDRKLDDVVRFTGWLEVDEIDRLLQGAAVGLQPDPRTPLAELSTMAKTIEYLARGVPVVAVDLLETRRSAGDAAVYVRSADPVELATAIDRLLDNPAARATMRGIALVRFRDILAWEHQATRYVRLWDRLLSRHRAKPTDSITGPSTTDHAKQRLP